jgi:hypothetical protein
VQFRKKAHIFKISEDYLLTWVKKNSTAQDLLLREDRPSHAGKKNSEPLPHPYKGAVTLVRQPLGYFSKKKTLGW